MSSSIPILVSGVSYGLLYALVGTGLVLIYRGSRVINFAFGSVMGLLAYLTYSAVLVTGSQVLGIAVVLCIAVMLGYLLRMVIVGSHDRFARQPIRARGLFDDDAVLSMIIATLGISLIIGGIEPAIWGSSTLRLPISLPGGHLEVFGTQLAWADVLVIGVAAAMILLIDLFLHHTRSGFEIRALFSNAYAANLMGLHVSRSFTIVWVIGTVAGLVAALLASSTVYISDASYVSFAFVAFVALVLGGLESIRGAIAGGLILGIGTSFIDAYGSSQIDQVVLLLFALVVLTIRPQGLLSGRADAARL